jgi:hypothetical protein
MILFGSRARGAIVAHRLQKAKDTLREAKGNIEHFYMVALKNIVLAESEKN